MCGLDDRETVDQISENTFRQAQWPSTCNTFWFIRVLPLFFAWGRYSSALIPDDGSSL